jgi:beta-lactam-binding protein with PASTA domain
MRLIDFILSKEFLKHLILAIIVAIVIVSATFIMLNIYTQHGETFPLPDFKKKTLQEVKKIAEKNELEIEVTDSVYEEDWPKSTVVKQNPKAGFHVKEGRTVFITKNASNPQKVKMPNVVGVSHRQAKNTLNNSGLKIGRLEHVPDIAVNNVLKQKLNGKEIKPGTMIPKGTKVDLVLGQGLSNRRSQVPDLKNFTLKMAKNKILQAAMNLGAVQYDTSINNSQDSIKARVWKQYPPYKKNKKIRLGSYIDLWLTTDSSKLFDQDTVKIKKDTVRKNKPLNEEEVENP